MCQNIVHERITNYTIKKALKCIQIKKNSQKNLYFANLETCWKLKYYLPKTQEDAIYYSM